MNSTVLQGLVEFLGGKTGVRDVKVVAAKPATMAEMSAWEQATGCSLPEDLKQFYLSHNGLSLTWSFQDNVRIGKITINGLSEQRDLTNPVPRPSTHPSLLDLDNLDDTGGSERGEKVVGSEGGRVWRPGFSGHCKALELEYCPSCGHTCLVYGPAENGPSWLARGVWLLDLSLQWHKLTDSFSDYLRQAVIHLGLRQWPYALTPIGLSPHYERWFLIFIPKRLQLDHTQISNGDDHTHILLGTTPTEGTPASVSSKESVNGTSFVNTLDIARLLQNTKSSRDKRSQRPQSSSSSGSKKTGSTQNR